MFRLKVISTSSELASLAAAGAPGLPTATTESVSRVVRVISVDAAGAPLPGASIQTHPVADEATQASLPLGFIIEVSGTTGAL